MFQVKLELGYQLEKNSQYQQVLFIEHTKEHMDTIQLKYG